MLSALLVFLCAGCTLKRTYPVQGRIVGFGDDGRTVLIEHTDIPGLMQAMTMSFQTRQDGLLDQFAVGDAVHFRLVLTRQRTWIEDLVSLPDSAIAAFPAGQQDPLFDDDASPLLDLGDLRPPFTLTNQDGETIHAEDFDGRALLLTFIYTRCPLPDYCPRLSQHFNILQPRLLERFGGQVQQLSISFDLEHDTPAVLRAYAARYTDNTEQWTFATGSPQTITRLAQAFGVFYEANGQEFDHNLTTVLLGPDGRIRRIWRGTDWQPDAVLQAVEEMLPGS